MKTSRPKKGDKYFPMFEDEYHPDFPILEIDSVEGEIEDEAKGVRGWSIIASDGIGYDCFWSEKHQIYVYSLE